MRNLGLATLFKIREAEITLASVGTAERNCCVLLSRPASLVIAAFAWLMGSLPLFGEIPLACHPPQVAEYVPPVYPADYSLPEARQAYSAMLFCEADGSLAGLRLDTLPVNLREPVERAMKASRLRPAHSMDKAVPGFHRVLLNAYFTPVSGQPFPVPQLGFDEAARDKLEIIARTIVNGWLRIRISVSRDGEIRAVRTRNSKLDAVLETIFEIDVQSEHPPFAPAVVDGRPVSSEIDLFWDFTLPSERHDYREIETELVQMGSNELAPEGNWPSEDHMFTAILFPHRSNIVRGAYVEADLPKSLRNAVWERAERWFIPDSNTGGPLEATLRYQVDGPALIVESFRKIPVESASLRFSARPIYPKRRFLPDPAGFVRVQADIGTDGWLRDVRILEASSKRFHEPAREALEAWHFSPPTFDGKPIPARIFLTLPLRPEDN